MHALAQHLQSQGRGNDSMLVHMTPREVGGLQSLAMAHGGSLTTNPRTGFPEAGFLESILPMLAGGLLMATGVGAPIGAAILGSGAAGAGALGAGLLVGGGTAAITGDITKGLMAGLGAYGGAGLAGALGASAAGAAGGAGSAAAVPGALSPSLTPGGFNAITNIAQTGGMDAARAAAGAAPAAGGLGSMSTMGKVALGLPLIGALSGSENSSAPSTPEKPTVSLSPPQPLNRKVQFPVNRDPNDSSEFQYFTPVGGSPSTVTQLKPTMTMAKGGNVDLEDGAFVVDARTVSEMGNGSSSAGQEVLSRMGGRPIRGPGDGVSDSIRANIGGKQEARVARDEVKFSPDAVQRVGGGSAQKGAQRLYALMHKAQQARKKAKRGENTGLAALVRT